MTGKELWATFIQRNNITDCEYEEWAFGTSADLLAHLVVIGEKTATSSAYPLYEFESEPLPASGTYSVLLDSHHHAVCIIKTTKVSVVPFREVTEQHAYKEGEGDKSLDYWRDVHAKFFTKCLNKAGLKFTDDMKVVCEEFELICMP
ncbi:MAG: ASCH domain-containing protein [Clostridia bacterium]|nr:ASCH domain-containing protein [Clostridia bacterium]